MQVATKTTLLCAGVVLLLTSPIVAQQRCTLPTNQDVEEVANELFKALATDETAQTVQDLLEVHFTCLATVALDMYAYASVVVNLTTMGSPELTQFQLVCTDGAWGTSPSSYFEPPGNLPAMPFDVDTKYQCYECEELSSSQPNYDPDSNCLCECLCVVE